LDLKSHKIKDVWKIIVAYFGYRTKASQMFLLTPSREVGVFKSWQFKGRNDVIEQD
jgi:hypothetical protein